MKSIIFLLLVNFVDLIILFFCIALNYNYYKTNISQGDAVFSICILVILILLLTLPIFKNINSLNAKI